MKKTAERDLFPGALEMMILQTLRRQPSHGYALVQPSNELRMICFRLKKARYIRLSSDFSRKGWLRPSGAFLLQTAAFGFTD
jgi:DNA-binding PadR family transcriptional regulator